MKQKDKQNHHLAGYELHRMLNRLREHGYEGIGLIITLDGVPYSECNSEGKITRLDWAASDKTRKL